MPVINAPVDEVKMKVSDFSYIRLAACALLITSVFNGFADSGKSYAEVRNEIKKRYSGIKPKQFSMWNRGVVTGIGTGDKIIALTLDACGGKKGSGYDRKLIDLLRENKIPATLFLCGLWIDANPGLTKELAADPLFEIENHGLRHKPLSVNGARIWERRGTTDPGDAFDEVALNAKKIFDLTGKVTKYYRSGTAYYDDVAVLVCRDAEHVPVNFTVISGDAAGFSAVRIEHRILKGVKNGAIIIGHMNQPGSGLYTALKKAIPELKREGYRFVKLEEYDGKLK